MSTYETIANRGNGQGCDPFDDPVGYLAGLGLEAELVAVVAAIPEAA